MKKILIVIVCLAVVTITGLLLLEHYCPILLSYWSGTARDLGEPVNAKVYTDGRLNKDIKVYHAKTSWDGQKANDYILNLKEFDKYYLLKIIDVDLRDTLVGRPVGVGPDCYDVVHGHLYQNEVGYHLTDFRDPDKGFGFDPNLRFSNRQFTFNLPPKYLKFDSIRIDFN